MAMRRQFLAGQRIAMDDETGELYVRVAPSGGIGTSQAPLVTGGAGAHVTVAIPAGTKFIDFLVDKAAYVVWNAAAADPFGANNGVHYMPNLNFPRACAGATYLHLKGTTAAIHTLTWNAIA